MLELFSAHIVDKHSLCSLLLHSLDDLRHVNDVENVISMQYDQSKIQFKTAGTATLGVETNHRVSFFAKEKRKKRRIVHTDKGF